MTRITGATRAVIVGTVLLVALGCVVGEYPRYVLTVWLIYALSALGLNLVMGFGRLDSLGHGGFMLVGAYATAIAATHWGWAPPLALLFAAVLSVAVGVLVGLPAMRLKHFSLAIVTFAFGVTLFQVVKSFAYTGGPQGLFIQAPAWQQSLGGRGLWLAVAVLTVLGLAASRSIMTSRTGRALRMIAANETVARSFGIEVTFYKLAAFAFAALLGALAGGLHGLVTGYVSPDTYGPDLSILLFSAVMIGGRGRLFGPFLGAAFVVALPELTQNARATAQIIYAVLFIVVVTYFPQGLIGMVEAAARRLRRPVADRPATERQGGA